MSVGVLIITHNGIGASLLGTAMFMLNGCPLPVKLLSASRDSNPDDLYADVLEQMKLLEQGDGVLILTDLYGSTPSNITRNFPLTTRVRTVSGLNLSMLLRVLNYPELALESLAEKAFSGGRDGIVMITND